MSIAQELRDLNLLVPSGICPNCGHFMFNFRKCTSKCPICETWIYHKSQTEQCCLACWSNSDIINYKKKKLIWDTKCKDSEHYIDNRLKGILYTYMLNVSYYNKKEGTIEKQKNVPKIITKEHPGFICIGRVKNYTGNNIQNFQYGICCVSPRDPFKKQIAINLIKKRIIEENNIFCGNVSFDMTNRDKLNYTTIVEAIISDFKSNIKLNKKFISRWLDKLLYKDKNKVFSIPDVVL